MPGLLVFCDSGKDEGIEYMGQKKQRDRSDVVFLVGAGASVPVGIPDMQGMYRAFLAKLKTERAREEKKTCQLLTKELGVKEDLEDFLLAANTICAFTSSSALSLVERAISPKQNSRSFRAYKKRLKQNVANIKVVRTQILDFIADTCFQFERIKACEIFSEFVDAVSKKACPVYSTNYDHTLEYVAREQRIEIADNFQQNGQRMLWDNMIRFPLGNALTIIKLHGSVTWYADSNGTIERIDHNTNINPIGKSIERLVIFPTRFKDIYAQHFFALYSHFLSSLSVAKVLVVIGHSLRDDYLRAGIIERARRGDFQMVVIDPSFPKELSDELKPVRLGRAGSVTHIPFKFEDFSDDLAGIMLNSNPIDIPNECAAVVHHTKSKTNKIQIKGKIRKLHAGDKKSFQVVVDAYLRPQKRPAHIRVWLETTYKNEDGKLVRAYSQEFLDNGKKKVGSKLRGMVQDEIPLEITIPHNEEWVKRAKKVVLKVALLKRAMSKPKNMRKRPWLAMDDRKLTYGGN